LTLGEAVREALAEEMRRDPRVCLIAKMWPRPVRRQSLSVSCRVRKSRVIDTPNLRGGSRESRWSGDDGLRPVVDIMFGDFVTLTMTKW